MGSLIRVHIVIKCICLYQNAFSCGRHSDEMERSLSLLYESIQEHDALELTTGKPEMFETP